MTRLPIVYSCSGCSSAAQLANHLAVRLDRLGVAQMSCIAGVGGDVESLVRVARSARPLVAIDGCPLQCVRSCLARHHLTPTLQLTLSDVGVVKRKRADFDPDQAEHILGTFAIEVARLISGAEPVEPAEPAEPPVAP